jgi:acyl-[acyl-carrier-protein]-phospholipid O-acyltransferase/long-chain-fatty-acid--[acyl-carrier-protein] ligase
MATVLFSSGSLGSPSPVVLTHGGLLENIHAFNRVYPLNRQDCVLGFLPFFHSFGYVATFILPLVKGLSAAYHPNPLESQQIGELARRSKSTILVGAPTFIGQFVRRIPAEDFRTLRLIVVGSEKLSPSLARRFELHFGIRVH